MRHINDIKQLGKTSSHRKAMFRNMVTSFFEKERIVTTKQKAKELKRISERLITRAKNTLSLPADDMAGRLHNKREVMKYIRNRDVIKKLFEDIAPRFKERKGGYTRIYLLNKRIGDAAEMSILELVEKKILKESHKDEAKEKKAVKKEKVKDKEKEKVKDKAKPKEKVKEKKEKK
ncbi:MAG: 50S ribosomal protein L17 [Spirochaetes bacterium]|jgi:large subunit ribosomal protein L17|nr:50S ribosomal protein L17 [Spirochaetota bacterium]